MNNTFLKQDLQTWHLHYKLIFWNGAYRVLEKSSSCAHVCMYVYMHIYTHVYVRTHVYMHIYMYMYLHICV